MKHYYHKIMMCLGLCLLLLLGGCASSSLQPQGLLANQVKSQVESKRTAEEVSIPFTTHNIPWKWDEKWEDIWAASKTNPKIISIQTYEDYRRRYPDGEKYDAEFFDTHGIIEYDGWTHNSFRIQKIKDLKYNNSILTLVVEEYLPELELCVVTPPIHYSIAVVYEKPEVISNVRLSFAMVPAKSRYLLSDQNNLEALRQRIESQDYFKIGASIKYDSENIEMLLQSYQLNEFITNIEVMPGISFVFFEFNVMGEVVLEKVMSLLEDEQIVSIWVAVHNFDPALLSFS